MDVPILNASESKDGRSKQIFESLDCQKLHHPDLGKIKHPISTARVEQVGVIQDLNAKSEGICKVINRFSVITINSNLTEKGNVEREDFVYFHLHFPQKIL